MSYENPTQVLDTSYGKLIKGIKAAEDNIVNRVKEKNLQQQKIQKAALKQARLDEEKANKRRSEEGKERRKIDKTVAEFTNMSYDDNVLTINDGTTPFLADENGIVVMDRVEITKDQLEQDYDAWTELKKTKPDAQASDINPVYEDGFDIETIYHEEVGGPGQAIKNEIETRWEDLAKYQVGSEEYEKIKTEIYDILDQGPKFVSILDQTVKNTSTAWDYNQKLIPTAPGLAGLVLFDGKPDFEIREEAARMLHFKKNQGRFSYKYDPLTRNSYMEYTSPTTYNGKNKLRISLEDYTAAVEDGDLGGLINVTNAEPLEKITNTVFGDVENRYKDLVTTSTVTDKATTEEKKSTIRTRIKNFDEANELLLKKVNDFIDVKGLESNYNPGYAQSNWQILGGPDEEAEGGEKIWTGSDEQKERAKQLLYNHVKNRKGGTTGIVGNGVTNSDVKNVVAEDAKDLAKGNGIKLNVKEVGKYFNNQKAASGTDGKAGYSYDNLYANFKSLKGNQGAGVIAVLNSGGNGEYINGAGLKAKYPTIDLADVDDNQLYLYKDGSNKPTKVNSKVISDFDIFLNEVNKSNTQITNKNHNAAVKLIDRDQVIAMQSDGDLPLLPGMA